MNPRATGCDDGW